MKYYYSESFGNFSLGIIFIISVGATLEACFMDVKSNTFLKFVLSQSVAWPHFSGHSPYSALIISVSYLLE